MTIETDVHATAKYFGLDPALLQAVVTAEGDIVKAVKCSVPTVSGRPQALEVLARSCVHAMRDFLAKGGIANQDAFVAFWGARWAPRGVANDPHDLNANWVKNVTQLWAPRT